MCCEGEIVAVGPEEELLCKMIARCLVEKKQRLTRG